MRERRKLIEVALPLDAINREAARERSTPTLTGHPRGLHLWWSRKPLTVCRAVLFASLVDDPSDVPDEFPDDASQEQERHRLFVILERLARWESGGDEALLTDARREIARSLCRSRCLSMPPDDGLLSFIRGNACPVYDPFCGGGAIPLEAARLGLRVLASDLNPVAVLITRALTGLSAGLPGLADVIRREGAWMRDEAVRRIGHLYPRVTAPGATGKSESTVLAWRWARTIRCPNPACEAVTPLVWSFSLATGKGWIQPSPAPSRKEVRYAIHQGGGKAPDGTCSRRGARCLCCDAVIPIAHVREEGSTGQMGTQLMAVVVEGRRGKAFLPPDERQEQLARSAVSPWRPEAQLVPNSRHVTPILYGMTRHADLYSERQLTTLTTLADLVSEAHDRVIDEVQGHIDDAKTYADAVATYLGLAVSRIADYNSTLCTWDGATGKIRNTFARQAYPMTWDFVETNPLANSSGSFIAAVESIARVVEHLPADLDPENRTVQQDAAEPGGNSDAYIICTDPPYYDNVPYADLSDYFYVWLRRALREIHPQLFSTLLTPKTNEIVADALRHGGKSKTKDFFESRMRVAVDNIRARGNKAFPLTIFYAFKQAEEDAGEGSTSVASTGWETMLTSLVHGGLQQGGTWPLRTELANRMRSLGSNALASSIVLACRPRRAAAPIVSRRDFIASLKEELPRALRLLQAGNIAPVDLAQAAIGPGMAIYTRYSNVLDADGRSLTVRDALALINRTLDEALADQEGDFDADSRWALAWFEQSAFEVGDYGVAETLSKAKNTSVSGLVQAGILTSKGGKVRLLRPEELPSDWDPATDPRLTTWEMVHHLIRALESGGESAAADLVAKLGTKAETARELCYRLYTICERKKRASEALSYNALVQSWPEITRLARQGGPTVEQGELFGATQ